MTLTVGFFDGVHRGHLQILQRCSTVITFTNHPKEILGGNPPPLLTPFPLKKKLLEELGLTLIALPFTRELANLSFEEFLAPYSFERIALGEGSAFGKGRRGTPEALREKGFQVEVVPKLFEDGAPISSSRIRALLEQGDLAGAEKLLGRPYKISKR